MAITFNLTKKEALIAVGSLTVGVLAPKAIQKIEHAYKDWRYNRNQKQQENPKITEITDEFTFVSTDTDGDTFPLLNTQKPDIFEVLDDGEEQAKPSDRGYLLSMVEFQSIEEENTHTAAYFIEDEILAGLDEELMELDKETLFGGIPDEAIDMLKEGIGVFVMCGDGVNAIEIVPSHGNYLEELREVYGPGQED